MDDETTQIPLKKRTRQKLRNISTKGETYDELINKLIDIRSKFEEKENLRNWFEENFEILGFEKIERTQDSDIVDYIGTRKDNDLKIEIETLSSDFVKKGLDFKELDVLICILADEKLPVETIEILDRVFNSKLIRGETEKNGYRKIYLLSELEDMKADRKPYKIDTKRLSMKINAEEKTINHLLRELSEENLIEIYRKDQDHLIKLTKKGLEQLDSVREYLERSKEGSRKKLRINGKLVSGFGEGKYYVNQEEYKKQFKNKLGFNPFPGTLDLKLDNESLKIKGKLKQLRGEIIEGFTTEERNFGRVECFPAKIEEEDAAICIPNRTHHEDDVIEIISPVKIRDKYELEDEDEIEVEVEI